MCVRGLCGGDNVFFGSVRAAHADVIEHSAGFQPCFLQDHAEVTAQCAARGSLRIRAVHADAAAVRIVEAHEKIDHRRFAAARRAYNGDAATCRYIQAEIADERAVFCIGEANVIERDLSLCGLAVLRQQFGVGRHFFAVEEFKQAVCAGERILKLGDNAGNLVKRLRVLVCVAQKAGEHTNGEALSGHGQKSADERDRRVHNGVYEARGGVCDGGEECRL